MRGVVGFRVTPTVRVILRVVVGVWVVVTYDWGRLFPTRPALAGGDVIELPGSLASVGGGGGAGGQGHGRGDEGQEVDSACAPLRRLAGVSSSACPSFSSFLCLARPRRKES